MSLNKVMLIGRLGQNPELKQAGGIAIANFSIATSDKWTDKESGEVKEKTVWHNVVCFKKTAELAAKFLTKGQQVYIEGKIENRSWEDKETKEKKYKTEVIAQNLQFIGGKTETNVVGGNAEPEQPSFNSDEEIPF